MDQPKIERVLRLIKLMAGNVNYTVEDLARRLNTSYRTIYRYIDTFKEAGFVVHKLEGGVYKLGKESKYFKELSQLIHFTEEETHIVNQLIEALDNTNVLKQNLRKKLVTIYDCTSMANCVVKGRTASNVNSLIEAIQNRKQAVLLGYASSHTRTVRDRLVEPFGFTTNYVQIWCYEPESAQNKLFSTSRITSVEVLDNEWQFADEHREGYIDVFRITDFEQTHVKLKLGVMARNLLIEEYPLAEEDLTQLDDNHWLLDTNVCNMAGVGRFVMGLAHDIQIIDSPELVDYVRSYTAKYLN